MSVCVIAIVSGQGEEQIPYEDPPPRVRCSAVECTNEMFLEENKTQDPIEMSLKD